MRKHVYEEPFDWDSVPTRTLLAQARKRNQGMRAKFGRYASLKNLKPCPNCEEMIGSREYRRHRTRGRWLCARFPPVRTRTRPGALLDAATKAVEAINKRFIVDEVVETMKGSGFKFTAENPKIATNAVLRRLVKGGRIGVVAQASGRAPSQYEKVRQSG